MQSLGFSTHVIPDIEGESRTALVHIRENGHVSVSVRDYQSGTQIMGEVEMLIGKIAKRAKRLDLFLAGTPVKLAIRGR